MVAVTGGFLGGLLGVAGVWALRAWYGRFVQDLERALPVDYGTFGIAVVISLAAGIIAGLYPAWRIGRANPPFTSRCNSHGTSTNFFCADAQ